MADRWIRAAGGSAIRVVPRPAGGIWLEVRPPGPAVLDAAGARELALELLAAAERIDPMPPPRDRSGRPERGRKR